MYGIIGEDDSDVDMLRELVKRIGKDKGITVKGKGFNGSGDLIKNGWKQLKAYRDVGCSKFVVCLDSDNNDPTDYYNKIMQEVILKSGVNATFCALVPIQEIEAWILADIDCLKKIIPSWSFSKYFQHPETVDSPKELLKKLSRNEKYKPRYNNAFHNPVLARHLNLKNVVEKCSSALPLFELVQSEIGNCPALPKRTFAERKESVLALLP